MNQTQIAALVEQATSADNQRPPIEVINQIVEQVNNRDSNAQVVADQLLRKLQVTQLRVTFFSLGLLDILMDKCNTPFHKQVAGQAFFKQLVAMLNNPKMNQEIQNRIAYLIKKWGEKFADKQETLPNFSQVYQALVKRGVQFPSMPTKAGPQGQGQGQGQGQSKPVQAAQPVSAPANSKSDSKGSQPSQIPAKFKKLVNDMNLVKGNINFTNEIIDQATPGEKNETLNDMFKTLAGLEPKLINMIAQIDDESVMSMCLIVNDDLHKTFDRYRSVKKGKQPAKFVPGESATQTMLTPSHIYTAQVEGANQKSDSHGQPAAGQPAAAQQAADVDLFDLMGSSQPAQQQPVPQQQPMPGMMQQQPVADPMMNMFMGQAPNMMSNQMQMAMQQRVQQQMMMNQQQMPMPQQQQMPMPQQQQQQPQQPAQKPVDPNDVLGRLNQVMQNMNTNQQQPATNPNAGGFNTIQGGAGANPFAGYQNPNHNQASYSTGFAPQNPFQNQGPSMESWQRDVNELGFDVKLNVPKKNQNDNVQEFKDLFATGLTKMQKTSAPKTGIDLTYNPGVVAGQQSAAQAQPQPSHQPMQKQLSLFDNDSGAASMQMPAAQAQPETLLKDDPFAMPPPMQLAENLDVTEKFGQLNLNQPISSDEEAKAQANIDSILGGFDSKPAGSVEAVPVDTSALFSYAGMETNRTEQNNTFDASVPANVSTTEAAKDPLAEFM